MFLISQNYLLSQQKTGAQKQGRFGFCKSKSHCLANGIYEKVNSTSRPLKWNLLLHFTRRKFVKFPLSFHFESCIMSEHKQMRPWWNRQTRYFEGVVTSVVCVQVASASPFDCSQSDSCQTVFLFPVPKAGAFGIFFVFRLSAFSFRLLPQDETAQISFFRSIPYVIMEGVPAFAPETGGRL